MADEPLVWHYGLMAERWAEFNVDTPELPFFLKQIARFGQPVLDVACGVGRLLVPLLRAGIDIDGCDLSEDMLSHCRRKAASEGLHPNLFVQRMPELNLPRRYKTTYICGSFGLSGSRENDLETLRRCHAHLMDNGALLLNIGAEYTSAEDWNQRLSEYRRTLPEPWPEQGDRRVAADGCEHVSRFRTVQVDPLEQSFTRQVRLEKWNSGRLVASEEYTLRGNTYFKHELLLMLKTAGFHEITVYGDYGDDLATADHKELVFIAMK